jgi:hypothetical protein
LLVRWVAGVTLAVAALSVANAVFAAVDRHAAQVRIKEIAHSRPRGCLIDSCMSSSRRAREDAAAIKASLIVALYAVGIAAPLLLLAPAHPSGSRPRRRYALRRRSREEVRGS